MKLVKPEKTPLLLCPDQVSEAVTEEDERIFNKTISIDLDDAQRERVTKPSVFYPQQNVVLAAHWHPEFVPMELIKTRVETMFPNIKDSLIIPTDHNILGTYDGEHYGVEADCYSEEFNQKIQLLFHMRKEKAEKAERLASMLSHTFKYRSSQLFEYMDAITKPDEECLNEAARTTGVDAEATAFVIAVVKKIARMVEARYDTIPELSLKNKLLRNYFDALRPAFGDDGSFKPLHPIVDI